MRKLHKIVLPLALLAMSLSVKAQEVSPVDFMRMNPFQINSNISVDLPYRAYFSIGLGNLNMGIVNTGFHYDNVFDFDAQGYPVTVNLKNFANSLKETNTLGFRIQENVLSFGFRVKKQMFHFAYNVHVNTDFGYNDGLFKFLANGNAAFVGEDNPAVIKLNLNMQSYQEFAFGYQLRLNEHLSIGARTKLLFGAANVKTDALSLRLYTDADTYALRLDKDIRMKFSLPMSISMDEGGAFQIGKMNVGHLFKDNIGVAFDLGAEYRFDEHFSAVAAVNDLGFIKWKSNNRQVQVNLIDVGQFYDNGSFYFDGLDVEQIQMLASDEQYRKDFMDTLGQYVSVDFDEMESYTTSLYTNVLLRGSYDIDAQNRFSAQLDGSFIGGSFRPAFTVAYGGSFFKMLDVCVTYSMKKQSFDNVGVGLAGNFGAFHIYLATNNLLGFFNPLNRDGIIAQFGILFNIRDKKKM